MNPSETVIVIRSLVPGGVAQLDGRLIPGDRLLFVNNTNLENASLDQAVQALKGAPKGVVQIGVAKPLPIPDSVSQTASHVQVSEPGPMPPAALRVEYFAHLEAEAPADTVPTPSSLLKSESF